MAKVSGYQVHDTDYSFENTQGQTIEIKAGVFSVLDCPSQHSVEGEFPMGEEMTCPTCGQ